MINISFLQKGFLRDLSTIAYGAITYDATCAEAGQSSKLGINVALTTGPEANCTAAGEATLSDGASQSPKTITLTCPKCEVGASNLKFTTTAASLEVAEYTFTALDLKLDTDKPGQLPAQTQKIQIVASTSVPKETNQTAQTIDFGKDGPYSFKIVYTGALTQASCRKAKVGDVELACTSVDAENLTGTYTVEKDKIPTSKDAYTVKTLDGCGVATDTSLKLTVTSSSTTGSTINTLSKMAITLLSLLLL